MISDLKDRPLDKRSDTGHACDLPGGEVVLAEGLVDTPAGRTDGIPSQRVKRRLAKLRAISPRPRSMLKSVKIGVAVIVVGYAASFAWQWWRVGRYLEATDDAYIKAETADISPRVTAPIVAVLVTDNQRVHAGDLLVRLDNSGFQIALAKAAARRAASEAQIATTEANLRLQLPAIADARAELVATTAEAARAQSDAQRYKALELDHAASTQREQQAIADEARAEAQRDKAAATLESARRQLDVLAAQLQYARAGLVEARAGEQSAQLDLSYCEIRSPIDGEIGNRGARPGGYATTGVPLLSVVPQDGLWVEANFKENQIPDMRTGQSATIVVDALPGTILHGHVGGLAPATGAEFALLPPENATGNFTRIVQRIPVRIELDGDGAASLGRIRPGLSAIVKVDIREHGSEMRYAVAPTGPQVARGPEPRPAVSQ